MARLLVTGMSGTGKTTVLEELDRRGYLTVDTDYGHWVLPSGLWDAPRMQALLSENESVVVSGTVENQVDFYDSFEHVVLLTAPLDVLLDRLGSRVNNPYGKTKAEQDEVIAYYHSVEPLLRRGASLILDGTSDVKALADAIERLHESHSIQ